MVMPGHLDDEEGRHDDGAGHRHPPGSDPGCHTALRDVAAGWKGTTWFIEGDIAQCFDSLDHSVMLRTLGEKIHDNRFLGLLRNMLQAGYLEDWVWNATPGSGGGRREKDQPG
ncbi:MAG TPA: hypothetical protein VGJ95_14895 [Pseudonocardiaceae bacterium]|jgi:hypothetical protein